MSVTSMALASLADTQILAQRVADALRAGDTLLLSGDLGTGKTTFAQFLVQALHEGAVEVTSPTFTLVQEYAVRLRDGTRTTLHHYDLYRIEHPSALAELGLDQAESGIRLIEWPQRLPASFAPDSWISLRFTLAHGQRQAQLQSGGHARERIAA